jgi:hypothetical protein
MVGRGNRGARVVGALTTAAVLSGSISACSYMFVNPPPSAEDRRPIVRCTSSNALPVADMLVGMLQVMRIAIASSATDADYAHSPIPREADIVIGVGLGVLFLSSSAVGLVETRKCREILAGSGGPDQRPWVRKPPSRPLSREQRKLEEAQEEAAVQARAAERARAARIDAGAPAQVDAGAPAEMDAGARAEIDAGPRVPVVVPAKPPARSAPPPARSAPAVRQRVDTE